MSIIHLKHCMIKRLVFLVHLPQKNSRRHINKRKYKSLWFNKECENARRDFRSANNAFRKRKSNENVKLVKTEQRNHMQVKKETPCTV